MYLGKPLRKVIAFIGISAFIYFLFLFKVEHVDWEYNASFDYKCQKNGSYPFPHIIHYCIKGPHIFFVETSGSAILNSRQACAIESTARHNPNMSIMVLMTPSEDINFNHLLLNKINALSNVQILKIDVDVFVHGTPLWRWYRIGKWKKSPWKVSHLSDALRFLLIWKYGGIYLDMDIVTLRSLEHFRNAFVTENWERVAAGIIFFERGHELIFSFIEDFAENYDPYNFLKNGPIIVRRNIQRYCDIKIISKISGTNCDVHILPPSFAFPIPYDEWEDYFAPKSASEINITNHFNSSYMIHVWNKFSKKQKMKIGSNSLYEQAIKQHCPIVYEYAQNELYI